MKCSLDIAARMVTPEMINDRLQLTPTSEHDVRSLFEIARVSESIEDLQEQAAGIEDVEGCLVSSLRRLDVHTWTVKHDDAVVGLLEVHAGAEFSEEAEDV